MLNFQCSILNSQFDAYNGSYHPLFTQSYQSFLHLSLEFRIEHLHHANRNRRESHSWLISCHLHALISHFVPKPGGFLRAKKVGSILDNLTFAINL